MTSLQGLYQTADNMGLQVFYFPMRALTAISTPDGVIGMDVDRLDSRSHELVCLAHEMGHCATGSFYTADSDLYQRLRCEERADRWAIRTLVPLKELKQALRQGLTRPDELAEHFDVPEEFLQKAIYYYQEVRGEL